MSLQMDYDDHRVLWDGICNHTLNSMYAALTLVDLVDLYAPRLGGHRRGGDRYTKYFSECWV